MRIALIAPPFIPVPPRRYGGTELFIGHLAEGLQQSGIDVVVYASGDSTVDVEVRSLYPDSEWPLVTEASGSLKDMNHSTWAIADAARDCDIIHLNSAPGLACSRFIELPVVYTVHHPREQAMSDFYAHFPQVNYVGISEFQCSLEAMPRCRAIHHGIDLSAYRLQPKKQPYLSFIGRLAPVKGPHLAIEVAKRTGIPLKIAGEIQPMYESYFESEIKPQLDGRFIEYIGEADLAAKNELLGNSLAMLFPIQWNEPFGLVMIESMACGTPVIGLKYGSVPEVVRDEVSGFVCETVEQMVERVRNLSISPLLVHEYAQENFSVEVMTKKYLELYETICAVEAPIDLTSADALSILTEPGAAAA